MSDFLSAIGKNRKLLFTCGLLSGVLFFVLRLQKPIQYTAAADFKKGSATNQVTSTQKILESISGIASNSIYEDPKFFLGSYPVIQRTIEKLNLQGTLQEKRKSSKLKHYYTVLAADWENYRFRKKKRPESSILNASVVIPDRFIFSDLKEPILLSHVNYSGDIFLTYQIQFEEDDSSYCVLANKKKIGWGTCDIPFIAQSDCSFTLKRNQSSLKGKEFTLTIIPLHEATLSLENAITFSGVKKNPSLIHVSYSHHDRHLAANIVNTVMDEFGHYLQAESEKKIQKQLKYLEFRQNKALESFESTLLQCKELFHEGLSQGGFITLEKEIDFMAKEQARRLSELNAICREMQEFKAVISNQDMTNESLISLLRAKKKEGTLFQSQFQGVDLFGAKKLLLMNQEELDRCRIAIANYEASLEKLSDPLIDSAALAKLLQDASLQNCYHKLQQLAKRLIDVENWSERERLLAKNEIETEKKFLKQYIESLIESTKLQENVLLKKIPFLHLAILSHLLDKYDATEANLKDLVRKITLFPDKWLAEQKVDLNKKMHIEMIETIMKSIEAKNIAYNMEYLNSMPLVVATIPTLPNPPRLFLNFFLGTLVGTGSLILVLFLREVFLGPRISSSNLHTLGYSFAGPLANNLTSLQGLKKRDLLTLRRCVQLLANTPTLLISSQFSSLFPFYLADLLTKQGEKVLLCDFTSASCQERGLLDFLAQKFTEFPIKNHPSGFSLVSLGYAMEFKEELLNTRVFKEVLEAWKKTYGCILIWNQDDIHSITSQKLASFADRICYVFYDERLHACSSFAKETIFVQILSNRSLDKEPLSLIELLPLLDSIKLRVSSSSSEKSLEPPVNTL